MKKIKIFDLEKNVSDLPEEKQIILQAYHVIYSPMKWGAVNIAIAYVLSLIGGFWVGIGVILVSVPIIWVMKKHYSELIATSGEEISGIVGKKVVKQNTLSNVQQDLKEDGRILYFAGIFKNQLEFLFIVLTILTVILFVIGVFWHYPLMCCLVFLGWHYISLKLVEKIEISVFTKDFDTSVDGQTNMLLNTDTMKFQK